VIAHSVIPVGSFYVVDLRGIVTADNPKCQLSFDAPDRSRFKQAARSHKHSSQSALAYPWMRDFVISSAGCRREM
jgi:hypothetical protein